MFQRPLTLQLVRLLRALPPVGHDGFEGLIAALLEDLIGSHFYLAKSGSQQGRDMSSRGPNSNVLAVECKRYGQKTELDERELLGELIQAARAIPDLDLWVLVTSRDIPSQLYESLNSLAAEEGIGFVALSSGDGYPSSLEVLCANSPEIVSDHVTVKAIGDSENVKKLLQSITKDANFERRYARLREELSSPLAGYANWRTLNNQLFLQSVSTEQEARANYGQALNVEDGGSMLIPRAASWNALAEWYEHWGSKHSFFAMLGEEGDGKTWAIASWLSTQIKSNDEWPAVLFVSSSDISETDFSIADLRLLFANLISGQILKSSAEQWQQRVDRWLSRPPGSSPLFLLVLDGINERRTNTWWRRLFERLFSEIWSKQVAVLLTCRTSYWDRYFMGLRHLSTTTWVLGPYNNEELNEALTYHKLQRDSLQDSLFPLIRKPRYFDLMIKHQRQIASSGDVTVARLIFEDWRDRWERKQTTTLSVEDFENVIRNLAQRHQGTNYRFSEQEIGETLPIQLDRAAILEDLRTGGVLQLSGGQYKVKDETMVFGFGLLLVDQLEQGAALNADPKEVIASWMEPHADMDIKAAICEFAALYVLGSDILSREYKAALLEYWVGSHNSGQNSETDLTSYFPTDPDTYVTLAEVVWSDFSENRWAQELLRQSFLRWYQSPAVSEVLHSAFERWLGLVHIQGSPLRRHNNEEADRNTQEIAEQLGGTVELGPTKIGNYDLTIVDDDGLLRLGRVALAVISHLPRQSFMRAIATGCLADAVMGRPDKYELLSWVIRTSEHDVWPVLNREVNELLSIDNPLTRKVASRLLSFEGSKTASNSAHLISADRSTSSSVEADNDPCLSLLQWDRAQSVACLEREDVNPEWASRQIKHYAVDPLFVVPQAFVERLNASIQSIDKNQMWVVLGKTAEEYRLETAEPILARHAPHSLATFVRSLAREIVHRTEMERRQLAIALRKHYLILQKDEQDAVISAWHNLISAVGDWSKNDEDAEEFLFEVFLSQSAAQDQLNALLQRPPDSLDLVVYENNFLPLIEFDDIEPLLVDTSNKEMLHRVLWFLATNASALPIDLLNTSILPLLNSDDSIVRSKVLHLVYQIKDKTAAANVVVGHWAWDPSRETFENHWGSLVLSEHGKDLSFDELCDRVDPSYLGYAVTCRGSKTEELQQYTTLLHEVWLRLTKSNADLPLDLPSFTIDSSIKDRAKHVSRWDLNEPFGRSITFQSKYSTWGGLDEDDEPNLEDWNSDVDLENRRTLRDIVREAITQQKNSGNMWFGRDFRDGGALEQVVERRSDLVDEWIASADPNTRQGREYIRRGSSFYDALCTALLEKQTKKGVDLYWRLQDSGTRIRTVDSDTEIDLLDFALFNTSPREELMSTWQRALEECKSDQELQEVALLAQYGTGRDWLWTYISSRIDSAVPLDRARSRVLLGFMSGEPAQLAIESLLQSDANSWQLRLVTTAKKRQDRREWAKHWFGEFLMAENDDSAWASFRLLLRCVDSSFWFWRDSAQANLSLDVRRRIFLEDSEPDLQRAIRENENEASESFLGQKILKRQTWPWM
jgi:hypothetical protein